MPPKRSSQRSRANHPRGRGRTSAATTTVTAVGSLAAVQNTQPAPQPGSDNLLLGLPAKLRTRIYDYIIPRMRKVVLDTSKPTIAIGSHALAETCKIIRTEFLAQVCQSHRTRRIIAEVKDFDFGRLIHHLRQNDRLTRSNLELRIRHTITRPNIDNTKLLTWMKFVWEQQMIPRYKMWDRPPVAMRKAFMTNVFRIYDDLRNVWDEVEAVLGPIKRDWNRSKGEMKRAKPGEKAPGGADCERNAGTDVDSEGEDEEDE